jgi:putative transposase
MPEKIKTALPPPEGPSLEALFRWQLVSQVLVGIDVGETQRKMVREVARGHHLALTGKFRRVSPRTLQRWVRLYQRDGLGGLEPAGRSSSQASAVLSEELVTFATTQKEKDPAASIPEILVRARQKGVISEEEAVSRSTLYRTLQRRGVNVRRRKRARDRDSRRFSYGHRMQLVLSDGKHFKVGPRGLKRVAMFFLDDATRYVLHVVVGTSESSELFLRGLFETICHHGLMDAVYLDKGPAFVSHDTIAVLAKIGVCHLQGEVRYPEGHGKIERFHRTVKADLLRHLAGRLEVDPNCHALELRLRHYVREVYNLRGHSSLQEESPATRFGGDSRELRLPENLESFRDCFRLYEQRRVTNDHVVHVAKVKYEMPRGHAGERVTLQRHLLDKTVHFVHQGRSLELRPVDLTHNARSKRGKSPADEEPVHPLPSSAAELAFQRAYRPVVDVGGGFTDPDVNDEKIGND